MKKIITVGFLTSTDPQDKTSWSGIHYRMLKSLEKEFIKVIPLGPVKKPKKLVVILFFINVIHILFCKRFNKDQNVFTSKFYSYYFRKRLQNENIDVVFAPAASEEIAYLETSIPICYLSDTSFNQIKNYYNNYSNFSQTSINQSNLIEQKAIRNSTTQVYPSEWASNYVIDYYKANSNNVFVVKFGANLDLIPNKSDVLKKEYNTSIKLLFLGVDWERKGGDIAFKTFEILLNKGYDVTLTVCGSVPHTSHPKMIVIPFLNKNLDKDSKEFTRLLCDSHILFVPTRSECFGIVFCEAGAYGLPVITTDTGGVTSIIENVVNGYALSLNATPDDYARKIQMLLDNPQKLKDISVMSRDKFDKELNWDVWAKKMKKILLLTINKDLSSTKPSFSSNT